MKNNCNVAKDLMPLVIDGVASEASQQYVDDHVAECTECAMTYGAMKVELPRLSAEKERAEMEKAARTMKKKRRKRIAWAVVLGAMMCFVLVVGGQWLNYRLTKSLQYPMAKSEFTVQLYKKSDGAGLIVFDLVRDDAVCSIGGGYGNESANVTLYGTAIPQGDVNYEKMYGGYRTYEIGFLDEEGWKIINEWVWLGHGTHFAEGDHTMNQECVQKIWVTYDEGQELIYKHGDEVPTCSPEMEAYLYALANPPSIGKPVEYDYDKLAELRAAVPEWQ